MQNVRRTRKNASYPQRLSKMIVCDAVPQDCAPVRLRNRETQNRRLLCFARFQLSPIAPACAAFAPDESHHESRYAVPRPSKRRLLVRAASTPLSARAAKRRRLRWPHPRSRAATEVRRRLHSVESQSAPRRAPHPPSSWAQEKMQDFRSASREQDASQPYADRGAQPPQVIHVPAPMLPAKAADHPRGAASDTLLISAVEPPAPIR